MQETLSKHLSTRTADEREDSDCSSSSDDSDSETEAPVPKEQTSSTGLDLAETSDNILTLVDDEESGLLIQPSALLDDDGGEGAYEEEGEGDEPFIGDGGRPGRTGAETGLSDADPDKPKKKKKKKKKSLYVCLNNCKYESVRRVSRRFGFKEVNDDEDWNLYWTDYSVTLERVMDMKKYQKINHFPGMSEICRKDLLARNMNRMLKLFPKEYNVFPKSWCLPADYGDFLAYTRQKKHKTYILKPESGCQGRGIWVTKNPKDIKPHEHMLCQQYVSRPFLIDGFKSDMRIYVLVTSCDPLRIFVFKDGLVRFATAKYIDPNNTNVNNVFMHLTNYAINKTSKEFIRDDEAGSKRRISTINKWFKDQKYDLDKIWRDVDDVIIKTLISAHAILKHNYRTCFPNHIRGSACFEILGFDIMFDKKLKPFLLEVNHSPSFHTDAKLDKEIKEALLYDTMNLVNFGAVDRRKVIEEEKRKIKERLFQRQPKKESKEDFDRAQAKWLDELERYEDTHFGNFRRIYPSEGSEKYEKFFHSSGSLYQETAAFKARSECARQQREEIMRKQEKLSSMLRKKKGESAGGLRPESPGSRRRRVKRPSLPARRISNRNEECLGRSWACKMHYTLGRSSVSPVKPFSSLSATSSVMVDATPEPVDSAVPQDIVEEEELERISALLQRDNLVRGLGIVEHVYRLLHCTPGTMGLQVKNQHKYNVNVSCGKLKRLAAASEVPYPSISGSNTSSKYNLNSRPLNQPSQNNHGFQTSHFEKHNGVTKVTLLHHGNLTKAKIIQERLLSDENREPTDELDLFERLHESQLAPGQPGLFPGLVEGLDQKNQSANGQMERNDTEYDDPMMRMGTDANMMQGSHPTGSLGTLQSYPAHVPAQRTLYHQGLVSQSQGGAAGRGGQGGGRSTNPVSLSQLTDRNLPHRTRYTTRKQGGRQGNLSLLTESTKVTPRQAPAGQQALNPSSANVKPQYPSYHHPQVIPQYQYTFPNVVKMSSTTASIASGASSNMQSLSVVSAPAPIGQRPEISSANSSTRVISGQQQHQDGCVNLRAGGNKDKIIRSATGVAVKKLNDLEMQRGTHGVVYS